MSKSKPNPSKKRLGTQLRGKLQHAYDSRGKSTSILFMHYSPGCRQDVVFPSQIEFLHFHHVEWDSRIASINYTPLKRVALFAGELLGAIVDVEITMKSGEVIWREVKSKDELAVGAESRANLQLLIQTRTAKGENVRHEIWTEDQIYREPLLLRNRIRAMTWLAGARDFVLDEHERAVLGLLRRLRAAEFRHFLALGESTQQGLFGAALLNLVRRGRVLSDLDAKPFSGRSKFYLGGDDER